MDFKIVESKETPITNFHLIHFSISVSVETLTKGQLDQIEHILNSIAQTVGVTKQERTVNTKAIWCKKCGLGLSASDICCPRCGTKSEEEYRYRV